MSWFAKWFNSKYYHILYKERDKKEAEFFINNLVEYLKLKKGSKLIDIGCGKGRHANYLNSLGFDVVGIDLSPNNIAAAKKNEKSNLHFVVQDMRKVYLEDKFDIAINLFTSFGYFNNDTDEQAAINAMAKNLKSEGILVIDFMNVKKVITNLVMSEQKSINNVVFDIQKKVENNYIIKNISIYDKEIKQKFQEKVKVLTLTDFYELITNADLKIINIFGNYKLDDFDATTSDRLILICKK